MKKKAFRKYIQETFNFDLRKEKAVYLYLCKKKLTKGQRKVLTSDIKFDDYASWRQYIVERYKVYGKDGLVEFSKMLNLLLRKSKKLDSFFQNVCIAYVSAVLAAFISLQGALSGENIWVLLIAYVFFIPIGLAIIIGSLYDSYGNEDEVYLLQDLSEVINSIIEHK